MKKILLLLLLVMALFVAAGCQRTTDDDIYGTQETPAPVTDEGSTEQTGEDQVIDEEVTDQQDASEEASNQDSETDEAESSDADVTVTEDAYDQENATEPVAEEEVTVVAVPESVDDPEFKASVSNFLEDIYYNRLFGKGSYVEGITEQDMVAFAVSYVGQNEYQEAKRKIIDNNFVVFVKEKRVEELVLKYFDMTLSGHHSLLDLELSYEDGNYLYIADVLARDEVIEIETINKSGDFTYQVAFKLVRDEAVLPEAYTADLEVRDDRLILVGYVMTEASEIEGDE